jgi:hypothetical protein
VILLDEISQSRLLDIFFLFTQCDHATHLNARGSIYFRTVIPATDSLLISIDFSLRSGDRAL